MGTGSVCEEFSKVEHTMVLLVLAVITFHVFTKYAISGLDITSFIIFVSMCFAGYFAMKSAQEIITAIEERKQASLEALKAEMFVINPAILSGNSKYGSSKYSKKIKMAS